MSVKLLWHTLCYSTGVPVSGLCEMNGEELVFITNFTETDKNFPFKYPNVVFEIYRPSLEQLNLLKNNHESQRQTIGGVNDYGKEFRKRNIFPTGTVILGVSIPNKNSMTLVTKVNFADIINPNQQTIC